jgi:hypothetical protein
MKLLFSPVKEFAKSIENISEEAELVKVVKSMIEELASQNRVFIPGGWMGFEGPGHAMLYECRSDGLFLIWNTGAGLDYHLSEETNKEMQYQPVKAYQLPKEAVQSVKFQQCLCSILKPMTRGLRGFSAAALYDRIDNEMIFLKAKEVDPKPYVQELIPGQFSGTCAWQVIASLVRNYGFKDLNFEEIYYEVMRDTLTTAVETLSLKNKYDPAVQNQFRFAIKNFATMLQNLAKNQAISIVRQQQGLVLISNINNVLLKNLIYIWGNVLIHSMSLIVSCIRKSIYSMLYLYRKQV